MTKAGSAKPVNLTREALTAAAYRYVQRFASTEVQLKKVLWLRIDRLMGRDGDPDAVATARKAAGEIAARCVELGLVNDRLYAQTKTRRLLARGKPVRMVRAALQQKGVAADDIEAALGDVMEESGEANPDFAAAIAYARRRRLGPFRRPDINGADSEPDSEAARSQSRKEYAAMARAGFGHDLSRRVLEAASSDELESYAGRD